MAGTFARILNVFTRSTPDGLFRILTKNSSKLLDLEKTFASKVPACKTTCFYETRISKYKVLVGYIETPVRSSSLTQRFQIVPKESAVLKGQEGIALDVNHSGLNKYGSRDDPSYAAVRDVILGWIQSLPPLIIAAAEKATDADEASKIRPDTNDDLSEQEDKGIQWFVFTALTHLEDD